jgi:hypothetical protein
MGRPSKFADQLMRYSMWIQGSRPAFGYDLRDHEAFPLTRVGDYGDSLLNALISAAAPVQPLGITVTVY